MTSSARKWTIYDLLSPILVVLTPFVVFLKHNEYSYATPEVWISAAALITFSLLCGFLIASGGSVVRVLVTAGLLTLFVDFQFDWIDAELKLHTFMRLLTVAVVALLLCWALRKHLSRIVTAIFATMLVATLVVPSESSEASLPAMNPRADGGLSPSRRLAPVVHIILDEQIGVEGIPIDVAQGREMRTLLRSFYESHEFRLFGRAYSRYASTRNAVPNTLNYSSSPITSGLVENRRPYVLKANKHFEYMHNNGYNIHVYQSGFIDLCSGMTFYVSSCRTIDVTGIRALENMDLHPLKKGALLLYNYTRLLNVHQGLGYLYRRFSVAAAHKGWELPAWPSGPGLAPVRAMEMLAALGDDVAEASAGQMFIAHLMLPHHPYVYDAACRIRDSMADWELNADRPPLPPNDAESRSRRYALYLEQMHCLHKKLGDLFALWRKAGVFEHMKIVIQGDHGSRINVHQPVASNVDKLSAMDYLDTYSTLFAVKASGYEPGYDPRVASVPELLLEVTQGITDREPSGATQPPYVFLETGAPDMLRMPLSVFDKGS